MNLKITPVPLWLMIFLPAVVFSQSVSTRMICRLPDTIPESSGIAVINSNRCYTHNDSGDPPRFFTVDTLGNLLRTIYLSGATATDFEEITRDDSGHVYIGDFGNNLHDRTDLKIYKLNDPEWHPGDTMPVGIINFTYPDQQLFPPPEAEKNFDCEAFIHHHDSLYLFSKNWGTSGYSKVYSLPDIPGNYTAILIDSIYTGPWITSAAINPRGNTIALLSESLIMVITGFTGSRFSDGNIIILSIDPTQKEGLSFMNDTIAYITDERIFGQFGNLYELNLSSWVPTVPVPFQFSVSVLNNPSHQEFTLMLNGASSYLVEVFELSGKLVDKKDVSFSSGVVTFRQYYAGPLVVKVTSKEGASAYRMVLVY